MNSGDAIDEDVFWEARVEPPLLVVPDHVDGVLNNENKRRVSTIRTKERKGEMSEENIVEFGVSRVGAEDASERTKCKARVGHAM